MTIENPDSNWQRAADIDEVAEGEVIAASAGGQRIALYKVEGEVYATHDVCTHEHAHLSEGYLDGCEIECPLHQGRFDIRTGKAMCRPVTQALPVYPVKIVGKDVFVMLGQTQ
ncbi:MAG: non-heme iron oxygenase ferredoxin subunit [Polaromonas sp.]